MKTESKKLKEDPPAKLLAKLPNNWHQMAEAERQEWVAVLSREILRRLKQRGK